jgi:hypothetical protein
VLRCVEDTADCINTSLLTTVLFIVISIWIDGEEEGALLERVVELRDEYESEQILP